MFDIIAPEENHGYVQGLNNVAMNFGMALAPWLFGLLTDSAEMNMAIWMYIAISLFAAAINSSLMYKKEFGPIPKPIPASKRV